MAGAPAGIQSGPNNVVNPTALLASLKSQAPAANPKTPLERLNPDQQVLENVKAASVSLERAQQFTNDNNMLLVFNAIGGVLSKALLKFDGQQVMQALQEAVQTFPPPVAPAGAGGPQAPGAPAIPPQMPSAQAAPQAPPVAPQGVPGAA
jgi:hypothetical protein